MILLWGTMDDLPMAMTREALTRACADVCFLDHRAIGASEIDYAFSPDGGARCVVRVANTPIDMTAVSVAYVRGSDFYDYDEFRELPADSRELMHAAWFEAHLKAWLDASDAVVINRTGPGATNLSKPYQMMAIRRAGLLIPKTLITNDAVAATKFLAENPDSIYKSLSGIRSIVRRVGDLQRSFIDDVSWCPTLFQRLVPGTNYRVHVINGEVMTVRIESDQVDYRYGRSSMTVAELPAEIAEKCRRLTAMLGLYFSGIDLMRTAEGDWYCFEVNTSPAYPYFESGSGQRISVALADFMVDADKRQRRLVMST
jgi:glutathione synthase/RimK-type ligase-like ATP-grasp enzyme